MIPNSAQNSVDLSKKWLGKSRRDVVPWTKSRSIDDCSYFTSWVQFGATNGYGPLGWVDNWKTAPGGTYHRGKAGLTVGDVVLFDWDKNGVGNHVERVVSPPNAAGTFRTIGANGSDTIDVAYRWRNAYVLGYWRADYGTAPATVGKPQTITDGKPAVVTHTESEDMLIPFRIVDGKNIEDVIYNSVKNRFVHVSEGEMNLVVVKFGKPRQQISSAERAAILAIGNR